VARLPRISIKKFLEEFKHSIEAEVVDSFWDSRAEKGKLRKNPELQAQECLGLFAKAKLEQRGALIREAKSGVGYVDVLVTFSSGLVHVVELKILKGNDIPGPAQLATYMKQRKRNEGWLVFFDARKCDGRKSVPDTLRRASGTIRTVVIDINPVPPSRLPD
jgi:Holliday junction resolvase-like predicted endonuclease